MLFTINWTVVSLSFAVATLLFYLYQWVLALIRKNRAKKQVKSHQERIQRFIDALKEKAKAEKKG